MYRKEIVKAALSWLGLRWQHQASVENVACDCVGLIRGVHKQVTGGVLDVPTDYQRHWPLYHEEERLYGECLKVMDEIKVDDAKEGDVLLFFFGKGPAFHMAIKISNTEFIHSWETAGIVALTRFDSPYKGTKQWREQIRFAFRFRELVD